MRRVVQVEGIFRVPGGAESCAELEQELSASGKLGVTQYGDLRLGFASCDDVHSVATVLSRWLRSTISLCCASVLVSGGDGGSRKCGAESSSTPPERLRLHSSSARSLLCRELGLQ